MDELYESIINMIKINGMNIKINQKLPNFIGATYDGQQFDLTKYIGENNIILYFYPKDDTQAVL